MEREAGEERTMRRWKKYHYHNNKLILKIRIIHSSYFLFDAPSLWLVQARVRLTPCFVWSVLVCLLTTTRMISVQSSLLILSLSLSVLSANVSITNDDGNIIVTANRMNISGSLYVNGSLALTEATLHALVDLETKVAELETRLFLAASSASYISTWDTTRTATGSSSNVQVRLPLQSNGTYNFTASWGDGSQSHITTSEDAAVVHTYSQEGNYTLALHGTIEGWRFNNGGDRLKLLSVTQWGSLKLGNDGAYFYGAENMQILATDPLDLSGTDNLERAFHRTNIGTMGNLNNWDTSKVSTQVEWTHGILLVLFKSSRHIKLARTQVESRH